MRPSDREYNRQNRQDNTGDNGDTTDFIDNLVVILCRGDITKKDTILWGFTMDECKPYLKFMERELLFREAVIGTLIDESKSKKNIESKYCVACKMAHPDIDCSKCNKDIQVESKEKTIG